MIPEVIPGKLPEDFRKNLSHEENLMGFSKEIHERVPLNIFKAFFPYES